MGQAALPLSTAGSGGGGLFTVLGGPLSLFGHQFHMNRLGCISSKSLSRSTMPLNLFASTR